MKLAIAQMVLGALIIVTYVTCIATFPATVHYMPFPWFSAHLVLGLAVLGCGIAQYLKTRG